MAVISVCVIQSREQVVSGIPKTVAITTNIPTTIFYTLDGSTPTLFSTMYTGPIFLPYNQLVVTLSILATNGVDSSPVVVETYMTDIVRGNARLPHAATTAEAAHITPDDYPFGTPPFEPKQGYLNPAKSGVTVYDPNKPAIPNAFGADGYPTAYSNKPYNTKNYQIVYNDRDAEGAQGYGLIGRGISGPDIGNIPGKVTAYPSDIQPNPAQTGDQGPEQTNQFTATFDPRALVIFQDFANEDPADPPMINRMYFTMEDPERARDGAYYYNTGLDATLPPSGSYVRSHYNPRAGTITHYYRDSWSNRWIIATSPYQPNGSYYGNLAQMALGLGGNSKVFEWIPFSRRISLLRKFIMKEVKFGKVCLLQAGDQVVWYRIKHRKGTRTTKTYYHLPCSGGSEETGYVYALCDGIKGRDKWFVLFYGGLTILNEFQNPDGRTYYKKSDQARSAAEKLIIKMDKLKAFI